MQDQITLAIAQLDAAISLTWQLTGLRALVRWLKNAVIQTLSEYPDAYVGDSRVQALSDNIAAAANLIRAAAEGPKMPESVRSELHRAYVLLANEVIPPDVSTNRIAGLRQLVTSARNVLSAMIGEARGPMHHGSKD